MAQKSSKLDIKLTGFSFRQGTRINYTFWGYDGMVVIGPLNLQTMNIKKPA